MPSPNLCSVSHLNLPIWRASGNQRRSHLLGIDFNPDVVFNTYTAPLKMLCQQCVNSHHAQNTSLTQGSSLNAHTNKLPNALNTCKLCPTSNHITSQSWNSLTQLINILYPFMMIYDDITQNNSWMMFVFGFCYNRNDLTLQMALFYLTKRYVRECVLMLYIKNSVFIFITIL